MQQLSGVLVEHDINDQLLYSPDQVGSKSDRVMGSSAGTPKKLDNKSLVEAPNQCLPSKLSSENPCSGVKSRCVRAKEHEGLSVAVTCVQSVSSSVPGENSGDKTRNDGGLEGSSM